MLYFVTKFDLILQYFGIPREWTEYYLSSPRSNILNLISLEISDTSLANLVVAPEIVRKINMINQIWPKDAPFDRYGINGSHWFGWMVYPLACLLDWLWLF